MNRLLQSLLYVAAALVFVGFSFVYAEDSTSSADWRWIRGRVPIIPNEEWETIPKLDWEETLTSIIQARDKLVRGSFDYRVRRWMPEKGREQPEFSQAGHLMFDDANSTYEHLTVIRSKKPDAPEETDSYGAILKDGLVHKKAWKVEDTRQWFKPFDPQSLSGMIFPFHFKNFGLAYYGDVMVHDLPDSFFAGLLNNPDPAVIESSAKQKRYVIGLSNSLLRCDQDYWVTESIFLGSNGAGGHRVISQCSLSLESFNGFHVPNRVVYTADDRPTVEIKISWQSLNDELPEQFADIDSLEDRLLAFHLENYELK